MTQLAAAAPPQDPRVRGLLLVFLGGLCYASAGLFVRALPFDPWTLLAWRSLAGGLFAAVVATVEFGRLNWRDYVMTPIHWLLVPIGAAATACYIVALTISTVAEVMVVYATIPFVTCAVAWLFNRERPSRRLLVSSGVALVGVGIMIAGGASSSGRLLGMTLVMGMNVGFALLLVVARRHPSRSMTPVNAVSLLLASGIGFAMAPHEAIAAGSLALMLVFGVVTVGMAMIMFMAGARVAPSGEVALIGISDVVLGPLMVFLVFGEDPGIPAAVGGTVVMGALGWSLWPDARQLLRGRPRPVGR